ncbi:MAG: Uma2 family endonuclease [Symploca sp. SIO2E6]|nr:Uma2 family endonuclease [Symploca sp. SIO2E6]
MRSQNSPIPHNIQQFALLCCSLVIIKNLDNCLEDFYDFLLWQKEPIVTLGTSIKLVVEVVSTNWQNDYARKLDEYQTLGITEYWIADYLGLGGTSFIGFPKQPTLTICQLENKFYKTSQFRGSDRLVSSIFSELELTAEEVFSAGK